MAVIAEGDILVNLHDKDVRRDLKALERDVDQSFQRLDNKRAFPEVDIDHSDFQKGYQTVQRQLDKLRAERATATANLDIKGMRRISAEIANVERKLKAIDGRRYAALLRVDVDKEGTRAVSNLEKTLNRLRDPRFFQNLRGKVGIDLDESDLRRVDQEIQSRISKIQRTKATLFLTGDTQGLAQAAVELENLRRLQKRVITEADALRQVIRRDPLVIRPELDRRELRGMETEIVRLIERLKKERIQLRIEGDTHEIERVEGELAQLDADLVALRRRRVEIKLDFDRNTIKRGLAGLFGAGGLEGIQHSVGRVSKAWNEFGGSVLGAGIRLGPLTLRLRTAITVMTVLGPLLISLTGAFASLGSVVYTGFLGVLGPATAGAGALAFGLAGIGGVLVPLIKDFGQAQKAVKAHAKAVDEHGEGSDQAKKKLEVLHNVMGNVGPETRKAVGDVGKLGGAWTKLTRGARPAFFDTIAEGVRSAKSLMPLFARESVKTFRGASGEVRNWLKGLRGPEAQGIFKSLFAGAQKAIPSLQRSLGNVFTFLGRIAQAAMPLWTEFTSTIERWTKGWADAAKDKGGVQAFLEKMKDSVVDIGKFLGASARLLHNFFAGGQEAGQSFLQTITATFNRWADFLGTTEGQNSLANFFSRSVNMAEQFFSIIGNIGGFFFRATQNPFLQAIASGLLETIRLITQLMNLVPGLNSVFAGLIIGATFLRALGPITKLIAAMSALKAAAVAFAGAQGMGRAVEAISAFGSRYRGVLGKPGAARAPLSTVPLVAPVPSRRTTVTRPVASPVSPKVGQEAAKGAAAVTGLGAALRVAATAAIFATAPFSLLVGGIAALTTAGILLTGQQENTINKLKAFANVNKAADAGLKGTSQAYAALTQNSFGLAQAQISVKQAQSDLTRLQREGKRGTTEYEQALLNLNQAEEQARVGKQALVRTQRDALALARGRVRDEQTLLKQARENGASQKVLEVIQNRVNKALNNQVIANVNVTRSMRGLAALTGETGQRAGFLVRQFQKMPKGDVVRKLFVKADTKQAEASIRNISKLRAGGISDKQIINVLANTDSAEEGLRRLRALAQNLPKVNMQIDAKDNASAKVNRAAANARKIQRAFVALLTGKDALTGKATSAAAAARRIVRTFAAQLAARDGASPIISGALSLLNSFNGRNATSTVTTVHRVIGGGPRGAAQGPFKVPRKATGGVESVQAKKGARVNRATFVAGEENRDEFVIASNPNYRTRNRKILKVAARALGINNLDDKEDVSSVLNDDRETYMGLPAYKKGKGPSKATKRARRRRAKQIGRTRRKWNHAVSSEQRKVDSIDKDIKERIQTREQDEAQFNIDLDNNPIVKTRKDAEGEDEDYVDEGARSNRLTAIQKLMDQTGAIMRRYEDLKAALKRAIEKMKEAIDRLKNRLSTATRKRLGKDQASKVRGELAEDISQITEDRKDANSRLDEIGEKSTRGEHRAEQLQWNTYESEQRQTRAISVSSQAAKAADTGTADADAKAAQAVAQADFYRRSSLTNEAALRAFGGSADIGSGALSGLSGSRVAPPPVAPTAGAALASAAAQGASQALAVAAPGRPQRGAGEAPTGGGPSIIIQTLHPGDPATLDAIGRAATGGLSLQGAQLAPRAATGL